MECGMNISQSYKLLLKRLYCDYLLSLSICMRKEGGLDMQDKQELDFTGIT